MELQRLIRTRQFGLYRNARFLDAEALAKQQRYSEALDGHLGVAFIDQSGPWNAMIDLDGTAYVADHGFRPENPLYAPGIMKRIAKSTNFLSLSSRDLVERFLAAAAIEQKLIKPALLPTSVGAAWLAIVDAIAHHIASGTRWRPRKS